jgi:REP element-mobilizing transposase RayT
MPNHVHLIIEVPRGETLNKIMHGLNLSYTLYFNSKYKTVGHLWQDRFKSKIIFKDAYFIECTKYVKANPIRANITKTLEEYPWSSYSFKNDKTELLESVFSI